MLSTLPAQSPKEPKLELLPEKRATGTDSSVSKRVVGAQYFDLDMKETAAQILTKFISRAEFGGIECLLNEICAHRITAAIQERDEMWRQHESTQISFLQDENSQMLSGLHAEIERLHHQLRDLYHRLYVKNSFDRSKMLQNENEQLRKSLEKTEEKMEALDRKLKRCEEKFRDLKEETNETIKTLRKKLSCQGSKIRQLNDELHEKTTQITKLMTQLPFEILAQTTENSVPVPLDFQSPSSVRWCPAPASFFGKKGTNLQYTGLIRNASIIYPGGRPNVIAQKCSYTLTQRSHHLPSLYAKQRSTSPLGHNAVNLTRSQMRPFHDHMSFTRSLNEIQSFLDEYSTTSSNSMNSKVSNSTNESVQKNDIVSNYRGESQHNIM